MRQESCYQDDRFNRFWTIEVVDRTCITTHGRIGSESRETRREIPITHAAQRELEKPLASKLQKGCVEGAFDAVPEYVKPGWSTMTMSDDVFWRITGLFNRSWKLLRRGELYA